MIRHVAIAGALGAAAVPGALTAEAQLGTGPGANYQVRVMSWSEIPFRSVIRQQYDFSCGSAAVATLLSFHYGRKTPEQPIFSAMWAVGDQPTIRRLGFSMLDIKRYLDGIGYRTEGYHLTAEQLRRLERPGIVILDLKGYKHFVVVKGIERNRILVGDPMLGLTRYSLAEFNAHWNGIFLTVVQSPRQLSPSFNLAGDWGPWSAPPLRDGASRIPVSNLTDNLPPYYQITPGSSPGAGAAAAR